MAQEGFIGILDLKFQLDIYTNQQKYKNYNENKLWKYFEGLNIVFRSHHNGLREVKWSHRSSILALHLLQEAEFGPLEVLSRG